MYEIMYGMQFGMGAVLLVLTLFLFRYYSSKPIQYIQFTLFCLFIYNIGYLFEISSSSVEAGLMAVKFEYIGSVFVATFVLFIVFELFKFPAMRALRVTMIVIDVLVLFALFSTPHHNLFYKSYKLVQGSYFNDFVSEPGIIKMFFVVYTLILGVLVVVITTYNYIRGRIHGDRIPLLFVVATSLPVVSLILQMSKIFGNLDISAFIVGCGGIMLFAMFRTDMIFEPVHGAINAVVSNMQDALVVMDANMKLLKMNASAEAIFPELLDESTKMLKVYERSDVLRYIIDERPKDIININDRYYSVQLSRIDTYDYIDGYYIHLSDRTYWKRYSDNLAERSVKAEEASEAKSIFLANASHNIRTPINAIIGMNEIILRESSESNIIEYATEVERAGKSLLSTINDILDISKIEAGKMDIIDVDYETGTVLSDVIALMLRTAREKGLELRANIDENIPEKLHGDEIRIKQILMNLLSNAVKYTDVGSIECTVKVVKIDSMNVELYFEVKDTGRGIKKEDIAKLCDEFKRIDEKDNRSIEGTGLGMSIVANLLNMMGSKLEVESEFGKGSVFSFNLVQGVLGAEPIGDFEDKYLKKPAKRKRYNSSFVAPDARLLVVDDNRVNLSIVRGLLKNTEIQIDTVGSGEECLEVVKEKRYDIIFLDHMMPGMDGVETLGVLNEMEDNLSCNAVVIVLTANAITGAGSMYKSLGFDDYLSKPIDYKMLERILVDHLPSELVTLQ